MTTRRHCGAQHARVALAARGGRPMTPRDLAAAAVWPWIAVLPATEPPLRVPSLRPHAGVPWRDQQAGRHPTSRTREKWCVVQLSFNAQVWRAAEGVVRSMTSGSDEVIGAVAMAVKQRGRFLEGHAQWPDACQRINTLPKLMDWEPPSAHAAMALLASIGADDVQAAIEAESTASDCVHRMYLAVARAWVVREGTRALSSGPRPLGSLFSSSNRHRGAFPMATTSSSLGPH